MHKIYINVMPEYLTPLISVLVRERKHSNLLNIDNLTIYIKTLNKPVSSYVVRKTVNEVEYVRNISKKPK